ncbi:hypothetical protein J6590_089762 [Homalodisca vitripennis]|nr:hypothetical protein J6590_089762 [Homalodisca vitripennis]
MGQTSPYVDARISVVGIVGSGTRIDHISAVIVGSGTRIDHISAVLTAESSYGSEWCRTKQSVGTRKTYRVMGQTSPYVDARISPVGIVGSGTQIDHISTVLTAVVWSMWVVQNRSQCRTDRRIELWVRVVSDKAITLVPCDGSDKSLCRCTNLSGWYSGYGSEWCQTKQSVGTSKTYRVMGQTSPYVDARISPVGIVGSGTRIDHISAVLTAESSYGSEWCQTKQSVDARNSPVGTIFELITLQVYCSLSVNSGGSDRKSAVLLLAISSSINQVNPTTVSTACDS